MERVQSESRKNMKRYLEVNKAAITVLITVAVLVIGMLSFLLWRSNRSQSVAIVHVPEESESLPRKLTQKILLTRDNYVDAYLDDIELAGDDAPHVETTYYCSAFQDASGVYCYNGKDNDEGNLIAYFGEETRITLPERIEDIPITGMQSLGMRFVETENYSVEALHIPDGITAIDAAKIGSFCALREITVDNNHPTYTTVDGILYDKACTTIIACPRAYQQPIYIPDTVTTIGERAFYRCEVLPLVSLPDQVLTIEDEAFFDSGIVSIEFGEGLKSIGNRAFENCSLLRRVTLPARLRSIGDRAFYECLFLDPLEVPAGIESIGADAFYLCWSVKLHMKMPERDMPNYPWGLQETEITWEGADGKPVFSRGVFILPVDQEALNTAESIFLPADARVIEPHKFCLYTKLKSIEVAPENPWYCSIDGILYDKAATTLVSCPRCYDFDRLAIPDTVKTIGQSAFRNCTALKAITLSDSIESIQRAAFGSCTDLATIRFGTSLKSVLNNAFERCNSLETVELPSGLQYIGMEVFFECEKLSRVTVPATIVEININAFSETQGLTVEMQMSKRDDLDVAYRDMHDGTVVWQES